MVKTINYCYKVSKLNFIWQKKLDENRKVVSNQLEEVSKAIGNIATKMETHENEQEQYKDEQEQIKVLLKEKDMPIENCVIKKEESGKVKVTLYTKTCENVENPTCNTKKMGKIVSNVLNENIVLQKQECGLRQNTTLCSYTYTSEDKMSIQIGIARTNKAGETTSGDTLLQTKL